MAEMIPAIGGATLKAAGSIYQGNSDANIAQYNEQIADQNATLVTQQGQEEARRSLVNSRKFIGQEEAGYGASGVSGGSAQWVMRASAAQGELNALTIQNNADVKAQAYRNEANLDQFRAQNMRMKGYAGAASAVLGFLGGGSGPLGGGSGGGSADVSDAASAAGG